MMEDYRRDLIQRYRKTLTPEERARLSEEELLERLSLEQQLARLPADVRLGIEVSLRRLRKASATSRKRKPKRKS